MQSRPGRVFSHGASVAMLGSDTDSVTTFLSNQVIGRVYLPGQDAVVGDGARRVPIIIDEYTSYSGR